MTFLRALLVALVALVACACRWPRTQLLVVVESDIDRTPTGPLASVVITVRSGGPTGEVRLGPRRFDATADGDLPFSFGVYAQNEDPDRIVWIEARACGDDGCAASAPITITRLVTRFDAGTTREVHLRLTSRCDGIRCDDASETCAPDEQLCVPADDHRGGRDAGRMEDAASDAPEVSSQSQLSLGSATTCTITSEGRARCVGGAETFAASSACMPSGRAQSGPFDPLGVDSLVQLAAGDGHVCGLQRDGTVWCRGRNDFGQLGDGTRDAHETAVRVATIEEATSIAAGIDHTCALERDGTVWCWGRGLDPGYPANPPSARRIARETPAPVDGVSSAVEIVAGDEFDCARRANGTIACWGMNDRGQLGAGDRRNSIGARPVTGITTALALAAGARHACARLRDGTISCWGDGTDGQLGSSLGIAVEPSSVADVGRAVRLAAGSRHTCTRDDHGRVACWGTNDRGQLGEATESGRRAPSPVPLDTAAVEIGCGREHTCVRSTTGDTTCWGADTAGQLGSGRAIAETALIDMEPDASGLSAGESVTCLHTHEGMRCAGLVSVGTESRNAGVVHEGPRASFPTATLRAGFPVNAIQVANGDLFTCALLADGSVVCWGANDFGQLGDGTTISHSEPVPVIGIRDAIQIEAGKEFGCALSRDGSVRCWGSNDSLQLGNGAARSTCGDRLCSSTPVAISGLVPVRAIACGGAHACALDRDDGVWCWGRNETAQTGSPDHAPQPVPHRVALIGPASAISAGADFSCAVVPSSGVWCWGENDLAQCSYPTPNHQCADHFCTTAPIRVVGTAYLDVVEIRSGTAHSCIRTRAGGVRCWGYNQSLQTGVAPEMSDRCLAGGLCVLGATVVVGDENDDDVTQLALGEVHTCALRSDHAVVCWGYVADGAIPVDPLTRPTTRIEAPALFGATALSAGYYDGCAIREDGVVCSGDNFGGQLGNGRAANRRVATQVPIPGDVTSACVGNGFACALVASGEVWCVGANVQGSLGNGRIELGGADPQRVVGLDDQRVTAVACGALHACAVMQNGTVRCWGTNENGNLGIAPSGPSPVPVTVPGVSNVGAIAAFFDGACVADTFGNVTCWGWNLAGAVGSAPEHAPPTHIEGVRNVVQLAAGFASVCARTSGGEIWCWGLNTYGSLGQGLAHAQLHPTSATPLRVGDFLAADLRGQYLNFCAREDRTTRTFCWGSNRDAQLGMGFDPLEVGPVSVLTRGLDAVTPGGIDYGSRTCAIRPDGTAACWGRNDRADLGDGTLEPRIAPSTVLGLEHVEDLYGGLYNMCARLDDGSLWCWGQSVAGVTGDRASVDAFVPTRVHGLGSLVESSAGFGFACGLSSDGTVRCAGSNALGQLGNGSELDATIARSVTGLDSVTHIASGIAHSCATRGDGSVWCWGRDEVGQLGGGTPVASRSVALGVADLDGASAVTVGGRHACAVAQGSLQCWGGNDRGQLGAMPATRCSLRVDSGGYSRDSIACATTPIAIAGLGTVTTAAAGGLHTCAIDSERNVRCWGANTFGQLGVGDTLDRGMPVTVDGLRDVVAVTASRAVRCSLDTNSLFDCDPSGEDHTCALTSAGAVYCWGRNDAGQLGDGTRVDRATPVMLAPSGVIEVRAGGRHTCIVGNDHHVRCVGDDSEGALGRGAVTSTSAPQRVAW